MCKLLAARLGSQPLEDWLVWESNGYPNCVEVPDYRVWPLQVKGHFSGPFGSGLQNAPVPYALLPKEVRQGFERWEYRPSVASAEAALAVADGGLIQVAAGADLALLLGMNVYEHQNCLKAWAEFSSAHFVELLNAVRNRVLDFSLALWKEDPAAGDVGWNPAALGAQGVTQIFNTTVYGGSANLLGITDASSIAFGVAPSDFTSLAQVLLQHGLSEDDLSELRRAIESDPRPESKKSFGPKVSAWVARMVGKAAAGTWQIGVGAAGELLAEGIANYYGF